MTKQEGNVIVNIKPSKEIPARQQKAWDEFLDMVVERAEAKLNKESGGAYPHSRQQVSPGRSVL